MTIEHRRPLIAFIGVALLCTFVMVQGIIYVTRSPMGGDLAGARGIFSALQGSEGPGDLFPEVVGGATMGEQPQPQGTTTEAQVPALDALLDAARTVAPASPETGSDSGAVPASAVAAATDTRSRDTGRRTDPATRDGARPGTGPGGDQTKQTDQTDPGRVRTNPDDNAGAGSPEAPAAPAPEDARPGNGPKPGKGPDHAGPGAKSDSSKGSGPKSSPARPAKAAPAPKPAKPPKSHPTKPAKAQKAPKDHGSQGKAHGHSKAPHGKSAGHGNGSQGKSAGHGKSPQGKAKGHGRH